MPVTYQLSPDLNLILYLCQGVVSETDFFESVREAQSDPQWRSGMFTLIDTLNAEIDFQPSELRHALEWLDKQNPKPTAILTQSNATHLLIETINLLRLNAPNRLCAVEHLDQALPILELQNQAAALYAFWQAAHKQNP